MLSSVNDFNHRVPKEEEGAECQEAFGKQVRCPGPHPISPPIPREGSPSPGRRDRRKELCPVSWVSHLGFRHNPEGENSEFRLQFENRAPENTACVPGKQGSSQAGAAWPSSRRGCDPTSVTESQVFTVTEKTPQSEAGKEGGWSWLPQHLFPAPGQ